MPLIVTRHGGELKGGDSAPSVSTCWLQYFLRGAEEQQQLQGFTSSPVRVPGLHSVHRPPFNTTLPGVCTFTLKAFEAKRYNMTTRGHRNPGIFHNV